MEIKDTYTYQFPAYALCALINGDYSGLSDDDEKNLNDFLERENYVDCWDCSSDIEPSFCPFPEFGLACDCVEVTGIVWK
jgi:hypothetical protein